MGHPETHPHSQAVVVYAEYSSSTLTPGLQLCKECNDPSLWRTCQSFLVFFSVHHASTQEFPEQISDLPVCDSFLDRLDELPVRYGVKVAFYITLYHPLVDAALSSESVTNG